MTARYTQITLVPEGEPIFSERGFTVEIDDQAAGEFVVVRCHDDTYDRIAIDTAEWPALRDAIDEMIERCR